MIDPKALEEAARELSGWIGYAYEGLPDRDISDKFPDWSFNGIGHKSMQGGKPAVRRTVQKIITAYLDALPPVDVAGLVKELRETQDDWPASLVALEQRAAAALERIARERDDAQARIAALEGALKQCMKEKNDLVMKAYPAMDSLDKALELLKMFRCRCRIYCIDAVHDCHRKKITAFLDAALAQKGGETPTPPAREGE